METEHLRGRVAVGGDVDRHRRATPVDQVLRYAEIDGGVGVVADLRTRHMERQCGGPERERQEGDHTGCTRPQPALRRRSVGVRRRLHAGEATHLTIGLFTRAPSDRR